MVLLRWPALGLWILLLTALVVPSPWFPGGFNFPVLLLMGLVGLWLVNMIIFRQRLDFVQTRANRPLLALCSVVLLSFVIGQLSWFMRVSHAPMTAQIGGLLIFLLSAFIFLLAANQLQDLRWLQLITWTFILVGWIHVAGWFVPGVGTITSKIVQFGVIDNSIYWTWLVVLSLSQAYFNRDLPLFWRIVFAFIGASTLYVGFVLNREWKSGYLPPVAGVVAMVGARNWRLALVMSIVGVALGTYLVDDAVASDEYSYSTRVDALLIMLEMAKVSPILGFGPANHYWYTPLYRIRGWEVEFNSHNQYVDIIAQIGLLGMACFLWFMGELAWIAWRLRTDAEKGFNQAYVYGVIGGIAGTMVAAALADWVFPFVYNIGMHGFRGSMLGWLFLGGLIAVEYATRQQKESDVARQTVGRHSIHPVAAPAPS